MEMLDSIYGFPGTNWCITLVFLVLIVRSKLSQVSENMSALCYMSASEVALRVLSSANRKSLIVSVAILDVA